MRAFNLSKVRTNNKVIGIISVIALALSIVTLMIILFPKGVPIDFRTETQRADQLEQIILNESIYPNFYRSIGYNGDHYYLTNETIVNAILTNLLSAKDQNFTLSTVNEARFLDITQAKLYPRSEQYIIMRKGNAFYFTYMPYPPYPADYQTIYTCTP